MTEAYDTSSTSRTELAKDQTRSVGEDARQGGRHVADVAKEETHSVAGEAASQARDLLDQTRSELMEQSGRQQQRLAQGLRSLADELASMARGSDQQGVASQAASRGASEVSRVAEYLDTRDPGSLLEEVRGFARRRPGTFLALAAGLGVAGGRLTRGMAQGHQDDEAARSHVSRSTVVDPTTTGVPGGSPGVGTPPGSAGADQTVWADATTAARDTRTRAPQEPVDVADPLGEARR